MRLKVTGLVKEAEIVPVGEAVILPRSVQSSVSSGVASSNLYETKTLCPLPRFLLTRLILVKVLGMSG